MNSINLLSPDFLAKTLSNTNEINLEGLYSSNLIIRSYILYLSNKNKYHFNTLLELIKKYPNENWDWENISRNPNIYLEDVESNPNLNWKFLSMNPNIKISDIESNPNFEISWLSYNPNLTMEYIKEHPDLNWNWKVISSNKNLTMDFVNSIPGGNSIWNWKAISKNPNITMEDVENNIRKPWVYSKLSDNPNLTVKFIEEHPKYVKNYLRNTSQGKLDTWESVSIIINQAFTIEDIENNHKLLFDPFWMPQNPNITLEYIKKYPRVRWHGQTLSFISDLTMDYINENPIEYWTWRAISRHPNISMKDIENNKDKEWDWGFVSLNPNLTFKFYEKYKDKNYRQQIFPNSEGNFRFENISKNIFHR